MPQGLGKAAGQPASRQRLLDDCHDYHDAVMTAAISAAPAPN